MEKYSLDELIAKGGYGRVYAGIEIDTNKNVAIKVMPVQNVSAWITYNHRRVPTEGCVLEKLRDVPEVVNILEHFSFSKYYYIVMERFLQEVDLYDYRNAIGGNCSEDCSLSKKFEEHQAASIFRKVVSALRACLERGVIHGDVKEENILIDSQTGQIKLIDFGASYFANEKPARFAGSRCYFPPEYELSGSMDGEEATVYALGHLFYNMLSGKEFCSWDLLWDLGEANDRFDIMDAISEDCKDIIFKCLTRKPEFRIRLQQLENEMYKLEWKNLSL